MLDEDDVGQGGINSHKSGTNEDEREQTLNTSAH